MLEESQCTKLMQMIFHCCSSFFKFLFLLDLIIEAPFSALYFCPWKIHLHDIGTHTPPKKVFAQFWIHFVAKVWCPDKGNLFSFIEDNVQKYFGRNFQILLDMKPCILIGWLRPQGNSIFLVPFAYFISWSRLCPLLYSFCLTLPYLLHL